MALKINLKGGDSLLIATSKFTVASEGYTTIIIEGDIPVMRESEAIAFEEADTAQQRFLYHCQRYYLSNDTTHFDIARAIASSLAGDQKAQADAILALFTEGKAFKALRQARTLSEF